jgi:predicted O-methyltransferase YrrM
VLSQSFGYPFSLVPRQGNLLPRRLKGVKLTPMQRLANVLALTGGSLAVISVGTVYLLQSRWVWQAYWGFFYSRTNRALLLASLLLFLAFVLKRFGDRMSARATSTFRVISIGFLFMTGVFIIAFAVEVKRKLETEPIRAETKYKFTFDGISTNAAVWTKFLAELKDKPNVHALEIGSFEGRSALWFLTNILTHETASITCVDLFFDPIDSTFDSNVKASGLSRKVIKLKGDSKIVVRNLNKKFDLVYIDGSHVAKDVLIDAVLAWDLVKPGGIIVFDDYGFRRSFDDNQSTALIPRPAIDAFLMAFRHHIDVLYQDYQVIVRKKPEPDLGPENILVRLKSLFF